MGKTVVVQIKSLFLQIDMRISTNKFYVDQAMINGLSSNLSKMIRTKILCICNNTKSNFKIA